MFRRIIVQLKWTRLRLALLSVLLASATSAACGDSPASPDALPQRVESQHLPNLIRVHHKVFSGGLPTGDEAFEELARLGVRTVISVDAAKPDVAAAKRCGLRYVHLPHGYDGISSKRMSELAKAVVELEGPIYIHCHHGKHRSPAASSVACVAAGLIPNSMALSILKLAGTDPHYRGLYTAARQAKAMSKKELAEIQVDYREISLVTPLAEDMVALEESFDRMKQIEKSGWSSPADQPQLEPAPQALLFAELFAEMLRSPETADQPVEYRRLLESSRDAAMEIFQQLRAIESQKLDASKSNYLADLSKQLSRISSDCKTCHHQYRDQ